MEPLDEYFDHQTYTRSEEYQYVKAYHNWLKDKGLIRDIDHIAERTDGKALPHPMEGTIIQDESLPEGCALLFSPTEPLPGESMSEYGKRMVKEKRAVIIRTAPDTDYAPAPSREMVMAAFAASLDKQLVSSCCSSDGIAVTQTFTNETHATRMLRALYPSVLEGK